MSRRRLIALLCLVLGAAALSAGCSRPEAPAGTDARPALTVELVSPTSSRWPERIEVTGRIAPWQEAVVGAEVGDLRLDEVLVNVGDIVTRGQVLARFNPDVPHAELALATATVAQREAESALARDQAARARRLAGAGALSEETILQYEADEKASAALLAAAQAQLQLQRLRVFHGEVRAPDAGVISARLASVGSVPAPGAELFKLIRQRRLEWHARVPADQLPRVAPGQSATLRLVGQPPLTGRVRQLAPFVEPGTLHGIAYVDLPDSAALRAGMFVAGELQFSATPALHVPASALVLRDGYHYVMAVDRAQRVRRIKVATGRRLGQSVELLGTSLTETDRLVRSGGGFLNEGDTVHVTEPGTASREAPPPAPTQEVRP